MHLRFEHISGRHLAWLGRAGVVRYGEAQLPEEVLGHDGCHAILATELDSPDQLVGILLYESRGYLLSLLYIFVQKPYRKQGIARRLILQSIESPINLLISTIGTVAGTPEGDQLIPFIKQLPFIVKAIPYPWAWRKSTAGA